MIDKEIIKWIVNMAVSVFCIVLTAWLSTSKAKKVYEEALEQFKEIQSEKLYIRSKSFDVEVEMYKRLNELCGNIYWELQGYFRVGVSTFMAHPERAKLNRIAELTDLLDAEIKRCSPFINEMICNNFVILQETAEKVVYLSDKYETAFGEAKEDRLRKKEHESEAYNEKLNFDNEWQETRRLLNQYLKEPYSIKQ